MFRGSSIVVHYQPLTSATDYSISNMVDWKSTEEIEKDGGKALLLVRSHVPSAAAHAPRVRLAFLPQWRSTSSCTPSSGSTCQYPSVVGLGTAGLADAQIISRVHRRSWEFVTSLPFDWQYISGKRKFKWPLVRALRSANLSGSTRLTSSILRRSSTSQVATSCSLL